MARDARGETGPTAQSRARATYKRFLSVALPLSASESAAAPCAAFARLESSGRRGRTHSQPQLGRLPARLPASCTTLLFVRLLGAEACTLRTMGQTDSKLFRLPTGKPSGCHSARDPLQVVLTLLTASASCCCSWRSAASARGSSWAAARSRTPCESHCESDSLGSSRS